MRFIGRVSAVRAAAARVRQRDGRVNKVHDERGEHLNRLAGRKAIAAKALLARRQTNDGEENVLENGVAMVFVAREEFGENVQRMRLQVDDVLHVDAADCERGDLKRTASMECSER